MSHVFPTERATRISYARRRKTPPFRAFSRPLYVPSVHAHAAASRASTMLESRPGPMEQLQANLVSRIPARRIGPSNRRPQNSRRIVACAARNLCACNIGACHDVASRYAGDGHDARKYIPPMASIWIRPNLSRKWRVFMPASVTPLPDFSGRTPYAVCRMLYAVCRMRCTVRWVLGARCSERLRQTPPLRMP